MRITLAYGRTHLELDLPDDRRIDVLEKHPVSPLTDAHAAVRRALDDPIGSPPLRELARGRSDAVIVVSDRTRPVPNPVILPPILDGLRAGGLPPEAVTIQVATGLHRPNTPAELDEMLGTELARSLRIVQHDARDAESHADLGHTEGGIPIRIDRFFLGSDLRILTGLIEPHLMAGYSGGRKLICPGIAALETVKVWHGPQFLEHPKADCGFLDGNPVHEENTAIARMAGCDFIVNVTLDEKRQVTSIVAGDMEQAFLKGVRFVETVVKAEVGELCDAVVTSCAGYPLDTTFYQSVKGLTGVLPIVKEGGTIIIAAGLAEGIGSPEFQQLFDENDSLDGFMQRILGKDYFVMDQWQLEELAKVCRKVKVKYVSDGLPAATLNGLFVETAESVEAAVADVLTEHGEDARIAVVPKGPYVMPVLA